MGMGLLSLLPQVLTDLWRHRDQDLRPITSFKVPCWEALGQTLVYAELGFISGFHGTPGPPFIISPFPFQVGL